MCFMLYVGTKNPLPLKKWEKDAPDLSVEALTNRDSEIRKHFSRPQVQYVGSTAGCGCDFPFVTFHNGGWPFYEDDDEDDPEYNETDRYNREALVDLLRSANESVIELYGIWAGHIKESPKITEEINLKKILDPNFYFKEQGFYKVVA